MQLQGEANPFHTFPLLICALRKRVINGILAYPQPQPGSARSLSLMLRQGMLKETTAHISSYIQYVDMLLEY